MYAVVNEPGGTAYAARITDPAMAFGGKSGSSQVRRISAARPRAPPASRPASWETHAPLGTGRDT